MADDLLDRLNSAYVEHPLTAASILDRVRRRKTTLADLTEDDLSFDEETHMTDQNHFGGRTAVLEIAELVGVSKKSWVLDIGTGLGGAARVLSARYGCRALGVEWTDQRYRDAVELTRLVGLEHLVKLVQGDFLTVELPDAEFDLVLGQASFGHFPDKARLMNRCAAMLKPGGYLAQEESFLLRPVVAREERDQLAALGDCWNVEFAPLTEWLGWMSAAGLALVSQDDLSSPSGLALFEAVRMADQGCLGRISEREQRGWRLAARLTTSSLLGYSRLIARKP